MEMSVKKGDLREEKCDVLVVNEFEGVKEPGGATGAVNKALAGLLTKMEKEEGFTAERGSALMIRLNGELPAKRVLVVGLGKRKAFDEEAVREAAAVSYKAAKRVNAKRVVSILHGAGAGKMDPAKAAKAMAEGVRLGAYEFVKYKKSEKKGKPPVSFDIVTDDARAYGAALKGLELGERFAAATVFARDLGNEPSHRVTPEELVRVAREIARKNKFVRVRVFDKTQLKRMGAEAFLGIAQGSDHDPFLVHLVYKPPRAKKRVALVGKAVTFDSGGLQIKPWDGMKTMKIDMAGAAAVLGVFSALAALKPNVEVHGVFAACENMPSGKAIKPGDVVRAMNKTTIEVLHTDAEGRVTLADALVYANKLKPAFIVDLATLTGACVAALGEEISGLMSNDKGLRGKLLESARHAGESLWELPLESRYKKLIKSDVADLKNVAGHYGGAITAGLFLQEFVGATPWAHIDIAGPSYAERPLNAYTPVGASGVGVRLLLEFLRTF